MNRNIEGLVLDAGFKLQKIDTFTQKSKPLGFMYKGLAIAEK